MSDDAVLRVAVIGAESTGKSALAAALAAHFGEPWAEEAVRAFWEARGGHITPWDLATIARGQMANEEVAAAQARRVVFCDTDLTTNVFWADALYDGEIAPWVREEAVRRRQAYALFLWCDTDLVWEADPQRCFADPAEWCAAAGRLRAAYNDVDARVAVVRGEGEARLASALAALAAIGLPVGG
ncbi:AAA family ATPase [Actomonas aquatica]|uniref:ATP-binding protein n=1 Tax=Actomonas aquatica TaxID=2866162 RepID=A0ABZ1CDR3_9BACT|nr:ATP-binding protein [Opitutus sp. WL0086]WRQ89704.1 ATP-binding protein [Opitutus sp. WL0086]